MSAVAAAQQPAPAPQRAQGTLTEGVTAVLVDVVVRDRRGQPVRDLSPADFEILEDGVPQKLGSFSPVFETAGPARAPVEPGAKPAIGTPPPVNTGPAVMALVFDRLTPEARRLAVQAAEGYLGSKEQTPDYIGIFGIDLSLTPYTPFTRNAVTLRRGLEAVGGRASAVFDNAGQTTDGANRQAAAAEAAIASAQAAGGPGAAAAIGSAAGEAQLAQMQSRMIREFDSMERDQQGYATTNGLLAVVTALRALPGRKSIVLFSEGIAIPPAVQRFFLGVIDAANRANVSIYTMDAAGLRAKSDQALIRDQVNAAARRGIETGYAGVGGGEPLTDALERNEDVLRQDARTGLGNLAQSTGGQIFDSTNNLRQGFERVESDLRNYYMLGYTPTNDTYDGRFRRIEVKVTRPGVTVAARRGYYAVRNTGGTPINAWEAPALGALNRSPVPNAFPVRASAFRFPERGRPGLTPVAVEFSTAPLTFFPAPDGQTYSSDFTVLVRFLDARNEVARMVSQHYDIQGPIDQLERAKAGDVIFYREPELEPGVYTMETIVYDAPSDKASVRFSTVEVPGVDDGSLRMSSLLLVKGGAKVAADARRPGNPLMVGEMVLQPNLGEPVRKSAGEAAFFFTVYPAEQGGTPESAIELLQNGKPLAQLPLPLAAQDDNGRIQQLGRLPLASLPPGTYELRAVATQGRDAVAQTTMLRIVE